MKPRCPRCESIEVADSSEMLEASDERFPATHQCKQCQTRFKWTAPATPFNPPHFAAT